ncbi:PREDICTED: lysozyme-like isoform X2 [Wasmannia auropunctata]|uniref:lysozyme-like isoform X2 n=1 Tax=Wasmannia auropunctata TaxID=64793 RepID=UPI0005EDBAEC|nr:PREDICTED: lysozyme-like isoform X2 [Wasmannia auropunctata]
MFTRVSWVAVTVIALFCVFTSAQFVSQVCLGCLCEASSGCNTTIGCSGSVCGPFGITWDYWSDADKPTLNGEPLSINAYSRCANDPNCAADTIKAYMAKFSHDCTGNGVIDCEDYVRIHHLGIFGCNGTLNSQLEKKFKLCLQVFQN